MLHRLAPSRDLLGVEGWNIVRGGSSVPPDARLRLVWADESSTLLITTEQGSLKVPTFVVRFDEVAQFTLSFASHEILISPLDDDVPDNTIEHLLVDQIWPRILAHRGQLVLHAAGVTSPTGAILFVGQSGRGKSTLTLYMAALVSNGGIWPDGSPCPRGNVAFITCEDDPADTLVPR